MRTIPITFGPAAIPSSTPSTQKLLFRQTVCQADPMPTSNNTNNYNNMLSKELISSHSAMGSRSTCLTRKKRQLFWCYKQQSNRMVLSAFPSPHSKRRKLQHTEQFSQQTQQQNLHSIFKPRNGQRRNCVSFADPLVTQRIEIPSSDVKAKSRLHYTDADFKRFAWEERLRRDALILTLTVCKEQRKRYRNGLPLLSPSTVHQMYHKILSRTDIQHSNTRVTGTQEVLEQPNKSASSPVAGLQHRSVAARCA